MTSEEKNERIRRVAVNFISKGQISKAMSRMNSCGLGNISNPKIMYQLRDKYLMQIFHPFEKMVKVLLPKITKH